MLLPPISLSHVTTYLDNLPNWANYQFYASPLKDLHSHFILHISHIGLRYSAINTCSILALISFSFVDNEGVTKLEAAAEVALSNRQKNGMIQI